MQILANDKDEENKKMQPAIAPGKIYDRNRFYYMDKQSQSPPTSAEKYQQQGDN